MNTSTPILTFQMNRLSSYNRHAHPLQPIPPIQKNRGRARRVRFADNDVSIPNRMYQTDESVEVDHDNDENPSWYTATELESFRKEARDVCRSMRDIHTIKEHNAKPKEQRVCSLAKDSLTRGLEQRSCLERQRRKFLANRCVIKAQIKFRNDPARLAQLSQRCTAWATVIAIEEAARDFLRAYPSLAYGKCRKRKRSISSVESSPALEGVRQVRARLVL